MSEYKVFAISADDLVTLGSTCPFCENRFQVGEVVTLHPTVPASPTDGILAGMGRPYTSEAAVIHKWCAEVLDGANGL